MKPIIPIILLLFSSFFFEQRLSAQAKVYKIILRTKSAPGDIDTNTIKQLDEPLRALTALYGAMAGTLCGGDECELTTALGLGKQGSEEHKAIIKKYLSDDKAAKQALAQDCYLRPSGASSFSEILYLTLSVTGDTIKVYYSVLNYFRGESKFVKGPDTYIFKANKFKCIHRNLWAWVEK